MSNTSSASPTLGELPRECLQSIDIGVNSRFANSEYWDAMELKPQDMLVLLKAAAHPGRRWTYAALAAALSMSVSEVHASVKRSTAAGLAVVHGRGDWAPVVPALLEFAVHGVRYVWSAAAGPVKRGVATSFGVEPLASRLAAAAGEAPVWPHPAGSAKGPGLAPIYRTAPEAALADPALHRLLALVDALRTGRARERALATDLLKHELEIAHAA